ncbi:MAG: universal stress protein UspA [Legionellales bacterium RIFCSPHIGHO2_12_FULL_35_11]|nr:MAG: universal stress protein UspA [Legionellales bacterium RIFCSPHIGHO2_12_FULL_35_11]
MYKNILHATDLSKDHFKMCAQARQIANELNANLFLIHVIESPTSLQIAQGLGFTEIYNPVDEKANAESILKIIGESLDIPVENQIVTIGSIKQNVIKIAQELECNLIIIGRHAHKNIPEFLDSTAHLVINNAPCHVLTIS